MTSLMTRPEGLSFNELKELCDLTDGNLNRHLDVLTEAKLIDVRKEEGHGRARTLCKITPLGRTRFKEYLEELERVIADAGRTACVIDVGALALQNAYAANRAGGRGATVALLDIGASATTITIVVDRQPAFERHVSFGGHACTEALQEALQLPLEAAEHIKVGGVAEDVDRAVLEGALHASIDTLVHEVQ